MSKARNGEGSIRPRQTRAGTVYDVQLSVRDRRTGVTERIFKGGFKTEKLAVNWRNEQMRKSTVSGFVREKPVTVNEVIEAWMKATGGPKAPSTNKSYLGIYNTHVRPRMGIRVSSLDRSTMNSFIKDTAIAAANHRLGGNGRATAAIAFRMVKAALRWAARSDVGMIDRNPLQEVPFPLAGKDGRRKAMPMTAVRRLLAAARPESAILWRLLAETGARRGEIIGLSWYDVDFEEGTVNISVIASPESGGKRLANRTKTNESRPVPLSAPLLEDLRKRAEGKNWDAPVLTVDDGTRISFRTVSRWWRRDMMAAGLNPDVFSPHSLRHTWATEALNNGVPVKVVSSILGHASAATTLDIYGHATASARKAAVDTVAAKLGL